VCFLEATQHPFQVCRATVFVNLCQFSLILVAVSRNPGGSCDKETDEIYTSNLIFPEGIPE
jgi:hypothetical protein